MDIQLIRELHRVTVADGEDAAQKGTQMLEIYALEIQMHNEMKNYKKLKVYRTMVSGRAFSRAPRKSTTPPMQFVQRFRIPGYWV